MSDIFILDDRPDYDPEVVERRKKQWEALTPEEQAEIDRKVAETVARVKAQRKQTD